MSAKVIVDAMEEGYLRINLIWPSVPIPAWLAKPSGLRDQEENARDLPLDGRSADLPIWNKQGGESTAFAILKQRLLLQLLDSVDDHANHSLIINEANTSARLASATGFPFLVYPCLFHERASEALSNDRHRTSAYWRGLRAM